MKETEICMICERPVKAGELDSRNAAVVGEKIILKGHQTCISNVDRFVVIPNRQRVK